MKHIVGLAMMMPLCIFAACKSSEAPNAEPSSDPYAPPNVSVAELPAYVRAQINAMREQAGLTSLLAYPELHESAQAHANYVASGVAPRELHEEIPGTPGFTAVSAAERAADAKFVEVLMGEWVALKGDASVVPLWLEAPFSRVVLLQPNAKYMGMATAAGQWGDADVLLVGRRASEPVPDEGVVVWPVDGAKEVPHRWNGSAISPALPEPPDRWPSGPVISAIFAPESDVMLTGHTLDTDSGEAVPHVVVDPKGPLAPYLDGHITLYPEAPLTPKTTYTLTLEATVNGKAWSSKSTFTTRP